MCAARHRNFRMNWFNTKLENVVGACHGLAFCGEKIRSEQMLILDVEAGQQDVCHLFTQILTQS